MKSYSSIVSIDIYDAGKGDEIFDSSSFSVILGYRRKKKESRLSIPLFSPKDFRPLNFRGSE